MRKNFLALLAAIVLVVSAFLLNAAGPDTSVPQPRVLPNTNEIRLH
jgi:hypothetical protein